MVPKDVNIFIDNIRSLPEQNKYNKEQLLTPDFLLERKDNIEIYYAPFDHINKEANVVIVGITPGWNQMEKAFSSFKKALGNGESLDSCMHFVKTQASFAGTMRKNLVNMLDKIHLNDVLNIQSCGTLFSENSNLLQSTSILKYPVFIKGKNYTGHNPEMQSSDLLKEYVLKLFVKEINKLQSPFIIPLGKAVSKMIRELENKKVIHTKYCLFDFPHPSGANGHRKKQFEQHKESFITLVKQWDKER